MNTKRIWVYAGAFLLLASTFLLTGTVLAVGSPCGRSNIVFANGLAIKKEVYCEKSLHWNWTIQKSADQSNVTLATGEVLNVNYTVTASAIAVDPVYAVSGNIFVQNTTAAPITITNVTDALGPVSCDVTFPYDLPGGGFIVCTYSGTLSEAAANNVVTVTDSSGAAVSATAPIDWSRAAGSETDECATVTDTYAGTLGTVCAGTQTSFTFNYSRTIGPYDTCGDFTVDNTATVTTNDTGASGSSSWNVNVKVPCAGGCSLTPGYWKTHSEFGPAPYDDIWGMLANGASTPFFSSGQSYYQVLWTPPSGGNAYYILAHAYIAAQLNQLNGADFSAAQATFNQATPLFSNPANTPAYVGGLRGSARNTWINLAAILDNYNNGLIGPGHCTE